MTQTERTRQSGWMGLGLVLGVAGTVFGYAAHERLTNPLENPDNYTCTVVGTIHAQTFTRPGATLVIPKLTGYDCGDGTIHWRHVPE